MFPQMFSTMFRVAQGVAEFHTVACRYNFQERVRERGRKTANMTEYEENKL